MFLTVLLGLSGTIASADSVDPGIVTLYQLIDQRLSYMKQVAAYKWRHQLPIEDRPREQLVLENAANHAAKNDLDRNTSRLFFLAQINAAKTIQQNWFNSWQHDPSKLPESSPDLVNKIRPDLIRLGQQIITQIELLLKTRRLLIKIHQSDFFLQMLNIEKLDDASKRKLYETLTRITLDSSIELPAHQDTLGRIKRTGTLRIGTTGDYAPFSYHSNGSLVGIDIELGKNLAARTAVDFQFVSTSWPTLMDDLAADKFDIAMSGISWNAQRQQSAYFSIPYHQGGKAPISRCEDVSLFDELAKIDRDGVRIIVNPAGTNQKFITANIRTANIRVFNDNSRIFDEIINRRADVMITDLIEVQLQITRHPELCASMGSTTLSHLEKAYLLPKDDPWKLHVDKWLFDQKQDGTLQRIFKRYLLEPAPVFKQPE